MFKYGLKGYATVLFSIVLTTPIFVILNIHTHLNPKNYLGIWFTSFGEGLLFGTIVFLIRHGRKIYGHFFQ